MTEPIPLERASASAIQAIRGTLSQIASLERELEAEILARERDFTREMAETRGRVMAELRESGDQFREEVLESPQGMQLRSLLSAPFIYSMIVPIAFLDLSVSLYQAICFRLYGIDLVERSDFIAIDRHHLEYLTGFEKLNCVYCGYGNGVFALAREIAARTEQYWCPIKHARRVLGAHERYAAFMAYGQEDIADAREVLREALRPRENETGTSASETAETTCES